MTKRKDIENLEVILLAIRRVENSPEHGSLEAAERLDTLHTALKNQCQEVVDIQKLEELETKNAS